MCVLRMPLSSSLFTPYRNIVRDNLLAQFKLLLQVCNEDNIDFQSKDMVRFEVSLLTALSLSDLSLSLLSVC